MQQLPSDSHDPNERGRTDAASPRSAPPFVRRARVPNTRSVVVSPLDELAKHPLLSPAEEAALLAQASQGDLRARETLVRCNMRLVMAVAARFDGSLLEEDDLIQEGVIGLMRAIDKWDPARTTRLSTYAVWWIRQTISRALHTSDRLIRVPVYVEEDALRINEASASFQARQGRPPSSTELAAASGIDTATLRRLLLVLAQPLSLSSPTADSEHTPLGDTLRADTDIAGEVESRDVQTRVGTALSRLDERSRHIVVRRFGLDGQPPSTLQQLADHLDLCRERVRQIETVAVAVLKTHLANLACSS